IAGGVISVLARGVYLDEPVDVAAAFRTTLTRLLSLIVASVIGFLLIGIGFFFLVIPGIYLIAQFFAVRQAVVLEDAGPLRALNRSGVLSQGQKLHILGTLILVAILSFVVNAGAAMLIGLQPSKVVTNVLITAVTIVVYPILGITETVLYYDTRVRNEG